MKDIINLDFNDFKWYVCQKHVSKSKYTYFSQYRCDTNWHFLLKINELNNKYFEFIFDNFNEMPVVMLYSDFNKNMLIKYILVLKN